MHSGWFKGKYNCNKCVKNKNLKDVWGCEKNARLSIPTFEFIGDDGIHYRMHRCPYLFISDSVKQFWRIYKYYKDYPSASMPGIEDVSSRFLDADNCYSRFYNELTEELRRG